MKLRPYSIRTQIDRERSRELKRKLRARKKNCYGNAFKVALNGLLYCEGIAACSGDLMGLVIHHGWVETLRGTVMDPTQPDSFLAYMPLVRFKVPGRPFSNALDRAGVLPLADELAREEWARAPIEHREELVEAAYQQTLPSPAGDKQDKSGSDGVVPKSVES